MPRSNIVVSSGSSTSNNLRIARLASKGNALQLPVYKSYFLPISMSACAIICILDDDHTDWSEVRS